MDQHFQTAKPTKRFLAYLIDILPIGALVAFVFYAFLGFDETLEAYLSQKGDIKIRAEFLRQRNWIRESSFVVWLVYCLFMESSSWQGTLGKRLMGIKVVDARGNRLTFARSTARNLSKLTSYLFLGLGFIWILFDKKKLGWHDRIAKTQVFEA